MSPTMHKLYRTHSAEDAFGNVLGEIETRITFRFWPGNPGTGTPYYGPPENYDPGSPPEVEIVAVEVVRFVDGKSAWRPAAEGAEREALWDWAEFHLEEEMIAEAIDDHDRWADEAAEARAML